MPTFRDSKRDFLARAIPDLTRLSTVLAGRKALLYVKPHPRSRAGFPSEHDNIRLWPDAIDPSTYLPEFTGLITDYSSILYDYLFLRENGAIVYMFDFYEYIANDRSLLYPFEENIAGIRVSTFDALCDTLRTGSALYPIAHEELTHIRDRFWGGSPSPASPAIVAYVESRLDS